MTKVYLKDGRTAYSRLRALSLGNLYRSAISHTTAVHLTFTVDGRDETLDVREIDISKLQELATMIGEPSPLLRGVR